MTNEETIAYFKECNERLVSVAKDENVYDYEKKEIEAVCMKETFDANEKAIQALEQTKWIPVIERLPEEYNHVLCQFCMGGMAECYYANNFFHVVGGLRINSDEVVAWMPLPTSYQPPKMMCEED